MARPVQVPILSEFVLSFTLLLLLLTYQTTNTELIPVQVTQTEEATQRASRVQQPSDN